MIRLFTIFPYYFGHLSSDSQFFWVSFPPLLVRLPQFSYLTSNKANKQTKETNKTKHYFGFMTSHFQCLSLVYMLVGSFLYIISQYMDFTSFMHALKEKFYEYFKCILKSLNWLINTPTLPVTNYMKHYSSKHNIGNKNRICWDISYIEVMEAAMPLFEEWDRNMNNNMWSTIWTIKQSILGHRLSLLSTILFSNSAMYSSNTLPFSIKQNTCSVRSCETVWENKTTPHLSCLSFLYKSRCPMQANSFLHFGNHLVKHLRF